MSNHSTVINLNDMMKLIDGLTVIPVKYSVLLSNIIGNIPIKSFTLHFKK